MSIPVVCPQCGKSYNIPDNRAGQMGKCSCGASMKIPSLNGEVEAPATPWSSPAQSAAPPPRPEPPSPYGTPPPLQEPPSPYGAPPSVQNSYRSSASPSGQTQEQFGRTGAVGRPVVTAEVTRPVALTVMIILVDIAYIISAFMVVMGMRIAMAYASQAGSALGGMILGTMVFVLALYVGILVVCHFLWIGRNWARITLLILMSLNVFFNLMSLFRQSGSQEMLTGFIQVLIAAVFIMILSMSSVKEYCDQ